MSRESEASDNPKECLEDKKMMWERRKIGLELRHRYELYFVTLTFTLLALAIQTAKGMQVTFIQCFEFSGWVVLLICGLLGLYMLQQLWRREVGVAEVENLRMHVQPFQSLLADVTKVEKTFRIMTVIRAVLFVCALLLLMVSRGMSISLLN